MKSTGVVKRLDSEYKISIPATICNALMIKPGEPLELFITDDAIIFKRYLLPVKTVTNDK